VEPGSDRPESERVDAEPGLIAGLLRSLAKLGASFVSIVHTRLELVTNELQQEVNRAAEVLVWTVVAILSAGIGLFLAALVVVFVFWDTHRLLASLSVTLAFFAISLVSLLVLRAKVRSRPRLLEGTLAELANDADQLKAAARLHHHE
jgi:uncharacterized membrane protein YqjE